MDISNIIVEFDYNKEALEKVKEEFSNIDKTNIEEVSNAVKTLVKMRGLIQKKGKTYRDDANAFNKSVIAKENEYVGIIEPLELEFKEIIEADKQAKIIEARKALLQNKKDQLSLLTAISKISDEDILAMDDEQWVNFFSGKFEENKSHLEKEKGAEARRIEDEKIRKENESLREEKRIAEMKALEAKEALDKIEKEKADKIKAEADEAERLAQGSDEEKLEILKSKFKEISIYMESVKVKSKKANKTLGEVGYILVDILHLLN